MCGICGVFGKSDKELTQRMMDILAHRGHDDAFLISGDDYTIGSQRLSIIDVSENGRQPMLNEDGSVVVAQNGEIYNYPELMDSLVKSGHTFKSRCDTEVIVHMYEEYGENFVAQLNGMFAIALWDDKWKSGLLVRDRVGEKPLYYAESGGCLYFTSEIKALLTLPFVKRELNFEALHHYLSYKHVPCPLTMFKGIWMLRPAHYLVWSSGAICRDVCYWQLPQNNLVQNMDEQDIADELLRLLKQSVKRRLISDVPIGLFLSGGVDSSLVTAIASELSEKPVETFTLIYAKGIESVGKRIDRESACLIAEKYGTNHHEEIVEVNSFPEVFPQIINCFDHPFAGVMSTYFLARQMRQHLKVALTGDGADELFGSYLSHRLARPIYNYTKFLKSGLSGSISGEDIAPYQNDIPYLASLSETEDWRWRSKLFVFNEQEKTNLYSQDIGETMGQYDTTEHLRGYFDGLGSADPLNRMLRAEFKGVFPDQVLEFSDKLSMAHSLELRAAYLDHEFVEFASGISGNLKIKGGVLKYILKKVAGRYLGDDFVNRSKEGFLLPITEWFYWDLRRYVENSLNGENLSKHGYFNEDYIRQLIDGFYNRGYDYRSGNKLLSLIAFQTWYDIYM